MHDDEVTSVKQYLVTFQVGWFGRIANKLLNLHLP